MAGLFDMKVGGLGYHITAHMIAIVALCVACFAITGYISFRSETVEGSALKTGTVEGSALKTGTVEGSALKTGCIVVSQDVTIPLATTAFNKDFEITQPANSVLSSVTLLVIDQYTSDTTQVKFMLGKTPGGGEYSTENNVEASASTPPVGFTSVRTIVATEAATMLQRTLQGRFVLDKVTQTGTIRVITEFLKY